MYQIGDIVVYGTEGIAEIGGEIEREFGGQKMKYFVLHPIEKKTETVYVPIGNEKAMSKMRGILTKEEAEKTYDCWQQGDTYREYNPEGHWFTSFPDGTKFVPNSVYYLYAIPEKETNANPNL